MQALYNQLGKYFDVIASASTIDTEKEVEFLKAIFEKYLVHSVLDIACGTGRHSVPLAEAGFEVVGIDYAEELLQVARTKADLPNLHFIQQDVTNITLDQEFDAAICMWSTFGELPYKAMLKGLKNVLKPKGIFVIDVNQYAEVPAGTSHKSYTNNANGMQINTEIDESYRGITRIREITNVIDGETYKDHSEMDVFTEADLIKLLAEYGFSHKETYYNYSPDKDLGAKRIQLVFEIQR